MNRTEHILHIAKLKNNCPECYTNDGLEISFVQIENENRFYKKFEGLVEETLYCHTCKNVIYPVNWTEDIDLVYQYNKKQAIANGSNIRLKPLSYVLILVGIVLVSALIYVLLQ